MEKEALSYKISKAVVYLNFGQFTLFLNNLAVEAQDHVYGYNDVSVKHASCKDVNTDDNYN